MWQRIQTLYLLLAIACNALLFILSLGYAVLEDIQYRLSLFGVNGQTEGEMIHTSSIGLILVAITILLSLIIIISFKKRHRQLKLGRFNLLVQVALVVFVFLISDIASLELVLGEDLSIEYAVGAYLSILPLILIYLAIRSIKKDDALVRAADRIR